jgi:archaellum component FlaC
LKNLVTVTVSETQLTHNFELILQALTGYGGKLGQHEDKIKELEGLLRGSLEQQGKVSSGLAEKVERLEELHKDVDFRVDGVDQRLKRVEGKLEETGRVNPEAERSQDKLGEDVKELLKRLGLLSGKV